MPDRMDPNWGKYRDDALRSVRDLGVIPITTDITPELAQIVIECASEVSLRRLKKITVLIDSNGGDLKAGIGIANILALLSANGVEVTGLVLSKAMSSAFTILQACANRFVCSASCLMVHWGQSTLFNDGLAAIMRGDESWVLRQVRASRQEMLKITMRRTNLTEDELRRMCDREEQLYAMSALELGLIDRIVDPNDYKFPALNGS